MKSYAPPSLRPTEEEIKIIEEDTAARVPRAITAAKLGKTRAWLSNVVTVNGLSKLPRGPIPDRIKNRQPT